MNKHVFCISAADFSCSLFNIDVALGRQNGGRGPKECFPYKETMSLRESGGGMENELENELGDFIIGLIDFVPSAMT